ncbi:hypothetical protein EVAR_2958_1 [Eumeta japonica]|uniref:Uncharacterized protein n=1 Tax=Eumeta variegata TaxID=151549 RepID=A0A4C1T1T9_EUMVA|nr:hypothetical protein EVAR_2958_1 [Eumeta japonica]
MFASHSRRPRRPRPPEAAQANYVLGGDDENSRISLHKSSGVAAMWSIRRAVELSDIFSTNFYNVEAAEGGFVLMNADASAASGRARPAIVTI